MNLSEFKYPESFKTRYAGVFVLTVLQFFNGAIHTIFGLVLVFAVSVEFSYSIYTLLYGVSTIFFAYGLWAGRKLGWLGTIVVSLFVIVVDVCAVLNIPLIVGVPTSAALGEIIYSLAVVLYLFQPKIIKLFSS
jgi:hypothetical protein